MKIFLTVLFVFGLTSSAAAEQIEINVHTKATPKSALGIFFSAGKVVQQPNTSFERLDDDTVVVRMPYDSSQLPSASPFASAYVLTEDGDVVFGDVRLVSAADPSESFLRIPSCPPDGSKLKGQTPLSE